MHRSPTKLPLWQLNNFKYGQYSNVCKGKSPIVHSQDVFIIFIFDILIYCSIYLKPKMLYCFITQYYLVVPEDLSLVHVFAAVTVAQLEDLDFSEQFLQL